MTRAAWDDTCARLDALVERGVITGATVSGLLAGSSDPLCSYIRRLIREEPLTPEDEILIGKIDDSLKAAVLTLESI